MKRQTSSHIQHNKHTYNLREFKIRTTLRICNNKWLHLELQIKNCCSLMWKDQFPIMKASYDLYGVWLILIPKSP